MSAYADLNEFAKRVTDKQTWVRAGLIALGWLLLVIGVMKMTGDNKLSDTTKTVVPVATRLLVVFI